MEKGITMAVNDLMKFVVSGILGAFIGAGSTYFTFKSASTAENHFYMQMDFRRYQTSTDVKMPVEERLKMLKILREAHQSGFVEVFLANIDDDISEVEKSIAHIEQERKKSDEAARLARELEQKKVAEQAKQKALQAVRQNPVIYDACLRYNSRMICP